MGDEYFKKITTTIIFGIVLLLAFFLLKPILLSILLGVILAFVFVKPYNWILKKTKSGNLSSTILCLLIAVVVLLPLWFLTPIMINQSFEFYLAIQKADLVTPISNLIPSFFSTPELSAQASSVINSLSSRVASYLLKSASQLIFDAPVISLHLLVIFFTFFFVLRDKERIIEYMKSILPFSKSIEKKLFKSSAEITTAVLYGQVVVGIIQGLIAGLGFIIFGVPNAILLTLIASIAGIFPIIGTFIIWVPVVFFLFLSGNIFSAIGVGIFGVFSSSIDNLLRPIIISKWSKIHPLIALIGMIGGLFFFGIIGIVLGPLILAYLLIILEVYRDRKKEGTIPISVLR